MYTPMPMSVGRYRCATEDTGKWPLWFTFFLPPLKCWNFQHFLVLLFIVPQKEFFGSAGSADRFCSLPSVSSALPKGVFFGSASVARRVFGSATRYPSVQNVEHFLLCGATEGRVLRYRGGGWGVGFR